VLWAIGLGFKKDPLDEVSWGAARPFLRWERTSGEFGDVPQGAVASGPGGKLAVAYVQMETTGGALSQTLRAATWTGSAWSPVGGALAGGDGFSFAYAPTLAFDSAGVLYVAGGLYSATNLGEAHVFRENR